MNYGIDWEFYGEGLPRNLHNGGLHDLTYDLDGVIYLATDGGMYIQKPGENVWQFMPNKGVERRSMESLLLTETNPAQIWVNTDDGVFRLFVGQ